MKAGLVHDAADWLGLMAKAMDTGRRVLSALRPTFYSRAAKWVDEASLPL